MGFSAQGRASVLNDRVQLPDWVNWLAQDADGQWWGYEAEPNEKHDGWYENEVGRCVKLNRSASPADWHSTLQKTGEG